MAEAFAQALLGGEVDAVSAGTVPGARFNPMVEAAMGERGVSMEGQYPKVIDQEMVDESDYAFTMGCKIDGSCPATFIPSEDWGLDVPAGQSMETVRRIRDEVEARVRGMLEGMGVGVADYGSPHT